MYVNWRSTINEIQPGNRCKTTTGEDQCTTRNKQSVGIGTIVEGVQRCICMDIQRSERDSTRASTTHNWVGYCYTPTHQTKYKLNPNYVITIK